MPGPRTSFATVKALQCLNGGLLCEVFGKFPDYIKDRKLKLPALPTQDNLDYEAVRAACMTGDMPAELGDVLSFVSILGTTAGWERIQEEAVSQNKRFGFPMEGLTHADLVMKVWLWDWPKNKSFLEEANVRARVHSRSSYMYFMPVKDIRRKYRAPTDVVMDDLRQELQAYFLAAGLGKGSNVVKIECVNEVWFLIRYPGRVKRDMEFDDDGQSLSHLYKPERCDAVVYNKFYGDLRMNAKRDKDRTKYRILFGHALFDSANVFSPNKRVVTLEPLKGKCLDIFNCADIEGLAEIAPVEVGYHHLGNPGREQVWHADKDTTLLMFNKHAPWLLPSDTDSVRYAIFRYRLRNRAKYELLTLHEGNTVTYERDGESVVLEDWVRSRTFFRNILPRITTWT